MSDIISKSRLIKQLQDLGVQSGAVLLVHIAFSKVKPVENDMLGLIDALETVISPEGTLVMPSMYWDEEIFDPLTTDCCENMGIVADTFWRQPDVLRGDNAHAFAAKGTHAKHITASQPLDIPHGLDSPVGRIYELDGYVLMLGIDQTANTTIHLAENLAGVRYRTQTDLLIMQDNKPTRIKYGEINHCCQNFQLVDNWLNERGLIRKGNIGHAEARLMRSQDIIAVVTEKLRENETIFLHPYGIDEECDEARAGIPN